MRPVSVQARGLMSKEELERFDDLWEIGKFLEGAGRFDLAKKVQKEIDLLAELAIDKMKRYEHRPGNPGMVMSEIGAPVIMERGQIKGEDKDE